uniref:Uncharacterized protein n=1 Tax=Arundo donax TaxID=35708 RepID=A0A0A9EH98_ARUDO
MQGELAYEPQRPI